MKTKNEAMKAGRRGVLALALALVPMLVAMGADLYVDAGVAAAGTGSQDAPYKTIQEAIAAAEAGAVSLVADFEKPEAVEKLAADLIGK